MYVLYNAVNQSIVLLCIPSKSTIRTFYNLGARLPSSCADLPKRTRNLMAHDPFNARGADIKSRNVGSRGLRRGNQTSGSSIPNPGNKYPVKKSNEENLRSLVKRSTLRL